MWETIKNEFAAKVAVGLFLILTVWWIILYLSGVQEQIENYLFGATYGLMAAWGGFWGITIAKHWGGTKSVLGKAILALSFGLLAAEFGQIVFSYYNIFSGVEVPYPSLADVGFFANIPLYTIGIILLAKASGIQFTLQKLSSKLQAVLLPVAMLAFSYFFFLQGYEVDWTDPVRVFLDFGYPLGQALYVSIAVLVYVLSKNILGGVMKVKVLFLLFAFVAQYLADYNFLFQNSRGTWLNAGYGDYLYLLAYFIMTLGLLQLKTIYKNLKA